VVNQVVAITAHHLTQTLCSGSTASFSVTATGTQAINGKRWNLINGTISGATSSTLTITNIAASAAKLFCSGQRSCSLFGSYFKYFSPYSKPNSRNWYSATTQTICSGTSASFNVVATGTGLSYQWKRNY
jgi:hypothetical protein